MQKGGKDRPVRQPQSQKRPGIGQKMKPVPQVDRPKEQGSGKLQNKIAVITGGDSGIGKAVAILFAKEGADIAIIYLDEQEDAEDTRHQVEQVYGRKCVLIATDLAKEKNCTNAIKKVLKTYDRIDVLVNNAALHYESKSILDISTKQLTETFATNVFSMFWITKAALPAMKEGSAIINTTSVTAYRGSSSLIDYSATKGAIVSFTRSLSANLVDKKIRVNAVAPGPIWTPLIAASFKPKKVAKHGSDVPMKRPGEPVEVAPAYLFLASNDGSYITGQVIHPNGGEVVNG